MGRIDQSSHHVRPRVVAVVHTGTAFVLWRRGQQHELALHGVDEDITTPIKETHRAQCLNDQLLDFRRGPMACFALMDGLGNLHSSIDLFHNAATQNLFGAPTQELHIAYGRLHLCCQALMLLDRQRLRDTCQRSLLCVLIAPRIKGCQRQRYHQHQAQSAHQMQPGHGGFIGRKLNLAFSWLLSSHLATPLAVHKGMRPTPPGSRPVYRRVEYTQIITVCSFRLICAWKCLTWQTLSQTWRA